MALHHAEECSPRPDRLAVLVSQDSRELVQVTQIVRGPGGEELGERDGSEGGVKSAPREVFRLQIQCAQFVEALGAQSREFIEQVGE